MILLGQYFHKRDNKVVIFLEYGNTANTMTLLYKTVS